MFDDSQTPFEVKDMVAKRNSWLKLAQNSLHTCHSRLTPARIGNVTLCYFYALGGI